MFTLFDIPSVLSEYEDNYFDLTLLQLGWLERICYWKPTVLKEVLGQNFHEHCLIDPGRNTENDHIYYRYYDPTHEKRVFDLIYEKSKHCLSIGFHSVKNWIGIGNFRIKEFIQHHYDALEMNKDYSSWCDYLHFPMDPCWNERYIGPDRIHYGRYDGSAADYIAPFVTRYINRIDKTINNTIDFNSEFYQNAKMIGNNIANITKPHDVILLSSDNSQTLAEQFIGCILYGRIPLIIQHPSYKISSEQFNLKIKHIIKQTGAKLCITDPKYIESYNHIIYTISDVLPSDTQTKLTYPRSTDIAFLQLSSGTTGKPKIIEVTHKQVIAHCDEYANFIGFTNQDVVCSWLPLYHDMGLISSFIMPLLRGAKFVLLNTFEWLDNPQILLEQITKHKATYIWMPNFAFNYMATRLEDQTLEIDLSSIKQCISCSELTFVDDLSKFYNTFAKYGLNPESIRSCYALAENTFAVSQSQNIITTQHKGQTYVSCGQTLPGTSVIIMKDGEDITTEGNNKYVYTPTGETFRQNDIEIGHVMIKSCYEPKTNQKSDFYGYYDTGDYGFMESGHLYITGRQKDAFNSYGVNIYPEFIEHEVIKHPKILNGRAACFGILNNGTHDIHICAETEDPSDTTISSSVAENLQNLYNISCSIHLRLPLYIIKTSSGKISRSATKEKFLNEPMAKARGAT